jgi:hypothetical protein
MEARGKDYCQFYKVVVFLERMKTLLVSILAGFCVAFGAVQKANSQATYIVANLVGTETQLTESDGIFQGNFRHDFTVEAIGGDVFVYIVTTQPNLSLFPEEDVSYNAFEELTGVANIEFDDEENPYFKILEGTTEAFSFFSTISPELSQTVSMEITGIWWNTSPSTGSLPGEEWGGQITDVLWQTDSVFIPGYAVPEPSASALMGLIALVGLCAYRARRTPFWEMRLFCAP